MLSISAAARNPQFIQQVPMDHDIALEVNRTGSDTTLGAESGTQTPQATLNQDNLHSSRTSTVPKIVFSKEPESNDANNHHSQLEEVKINSQAQSRGRTKS